MTKQSKAELALLGVTFIWGTSFAIVKDALAHINPIDFLSQRFLLASAVLVLLFWRDIRRLRQKDLMAGVWIGVILWVSFTFQIKGLELTTPSKSAFVTGFSVILVPLFESLLKRRVPSWINLMCAVSAFIGLYLLSGTQSIVPLDRGILLTFFCAVGFAMHVIAVDHFARDRNVNILVTTQIVTAAVASVIFSGGHAVAHLVLSQRVLVALFVTAVLATAFAFYVQNWAQKHTLPSRTALILSLEPVFAALVAYVTIHETWTVRMMLGCLLIFAGIIVSELQSKDKIPLEAMN